MAKKNGWAITIDLASIVCSLSRMASSFIKVARNRGRFDISELAGKPSHPSLIQDHPIESLDKPMPSHLTYMHDRPATEDSLGRGHFANALSRALVLPKGSPGLVVGIDGGWGSGKSTLIGFVIKSLRNTTAEDAPIVIEFNPWMVSNTGAIVEALIGQVAVSIGKHFTDGKRGMAASQKLLGYVGLLKSLKYVPGLSWAGHVAEDIPSIWQVVATTAEQGTEAGQKALEDFKKLLPSLDLTKRRNEVVAALEELDRSIVIVIDDLDRLPAEEIRAMIQAIKAVADFPRITYLLAYDRNVVACALGADKESGLSYLEKIIQIAYPIPPLSHRQLRRFAEDKVQSLLNGLQSNLREFEQDRYEEALTLLTKIARHPRDVVRVINRLALSLPATNKGVNAADVIVFEALSQRFPDLREAIRTHPSDFVNSPFRDDQVKKGNGGIDWSEYFHDEDKSNSGPRWIKHLPKGEYDQKIASKSCAFLFIPQTKGGRSVSAEDYLGIADPDRLARLLRMTSIDEVPEVEEVHDLLNDHVRLQATLIDEENVQFLLEWMINYAPSCAISDVTKTIDGLIVSIRQLALQDKLTEELDEKFGDLLERLLRSKQAEYQEGFLNITNNAPLSIAQHIVRVAATEIGKWRPHPERKVAEDQQLIPDDLKVGEAVNKWLQRVEASISSGLLHKELNLIGILHRLGQFDLGGYIKVYDAISKMCSNEEGLKSFLKYFVKGSHNFRDELLLVEDANKLASRISSSTLKDEYHWLVVILNSDEVVNFTQNEAAKHYEAQELMKLASGAASS